MTRKDYIALAAALRADANHLLPRAMPFDYRTADLWQQGAYDQWSTTVLAIGRVLAADNPRFDSERFYSAAGFRGGSK
jgi:hypothetical protein